MQLSLVTRRRNVAGKGGRVGGREGERGSYVSVLSRMRRRGREESEKDKQSPLGRACDGQRAQTMRVKGATSLATFLAGRSSFFEDFVPLPWTHGKFSSVRRGRSNSHEYYLQDAQRRFVCILLRRGHGSSVCEHFAP